MNTMPAVSSSAIASIDYDADTQALYVRFHESGQYIYSPVPEEVYDAFLSAGSKGAFFNDHIKDQYPMRRTSNRIGGNR
jgi:hypothetical protein